jgi:hypothetical protein
MKKVVGLGKNMSVSEPLMVTCFASKVGVGLLPGVIAQHRKAVEVLQPDVELGGSSRLC